jgi:hypothetical protein
MTTRPSPARESYEAPVVQFDRERIAKLTGHYLGCRCCWCGLGEQVQLWEYTAKKFDEASNTFRSISWPFWPFTSKKTAP